MKEDFSELRHPLFNSTSNIIFPRLEKAIYSRSVIDTGGTEENIPKSGRCILGFFPHSGWSEPVTILPFVRQMRNQESKWITKIENTRLEPLLGSENFAYVDRDNFLKSEEEKVDRLFAAEDACVCTAFEGTRYWDPNNIDDVEPLAKFNRGIVSFAMKYEAHLVIVATTGASNVSPNFDKTISSLNLVEIKREYDEIMNKKDKHQFKVRFIPYHREEEEMKSDSILTGKNYLRKLIHHHNLVTQKALSTLHELEPEYPLGHYKRV